jgi:hypothetical protein
LHLKFTVREKENILITRLSKLFLKCINHRSVMTDWWVLFFHCLYFFPSVFLSVLPVHLLTPGFVQRLWEILPSNSDKAERFDLSE